MRRDGRKHHEQLELQRISRTSQFMITDMTVTSPDAMCNNTDTRTFKPNQASCTADFSYPHVSSILFSSSSRISLFLVYNSTIGAEHKDNWSLSIPPCHHHDLTTSRSIHQVAAYTKFKHTPSCSIYQVAVYTECSIHPVQHIPKIVRCPSILTITSSPLNVASSPQHVSQYRLTATSQLVIRAWKVKSPCDIPTDCS